MFGYIVPYKEELKIKTYREYRNAYCELCNSIRKKYGCICTFFLNYEVTFLYILLDSCDVNLSESSDIRCYINPFIHHKANINKELLDYVSFVNMYLMVMKLDDDYNDERNILKKLLSHLIKRKKQYKTDCIKYEEIFLKIKDEMERFSVFEKQKISNFDMISACMGNVLKSMVHYYYDCIEKHVSDINEYRIEELTYHLGKWIYLIDALDDLDEDIKNKSYNPLITQPCSEKNKIYERGYFMLQLMEQNIEEQNQYIEYQRHSEIINNIIRYGLKQKSCQIIESRYQKKTRDEVK